MVYTACQLNKLHSFRLLHKIHCTGETVAHSSHLQINSSALLSTYSRANGRDTELALPCMMTEAGSQRLQSTVRSYDRLLPEVRNLSLRAFMHDGSGIRVGYEWAQS